jgi:hypothetical protein
MAYDSIGDIHGQALMIEALLDRLGYSRKAGACRHPGWVTVFVGDFIDRGPINWQSSTLSAGWSRRTPPRRCSATTSSMPSPGTPRIRVGGNGDFLRPRFHSKWGDKNRHQREQNTKRK